MIEPAPDAAEMARQQLLLLAWFSPAFPIGSFAFSHGLEWAQECGAVTDRAALEGWIADLLAHGSARTDAIFVAEAWRGQTPVAELVDLAFALQPSRERHLEASVQGRAFMQMVEVAYGPCSGVHPPLEGEGRELSERGGVKPQREAPHPGAIAPTLPLDGRVNERLTLPVAVGIAGRAHRVDLAPLLTAYVAAFVANLSSAAVRLGIVGQTDGQRIIAALHPAVAALAGEAADLTLDDLGSACLRADLFSLQHETQYSRLFRS